MIVSNRRLLDGSTDILRCVSCCSPNVRPSKRRSVWDSLFRLARMSAYRCRSCRKRFYAAVPEAEEIGTAALAARNRVEQSCY
jgi:hypothetical protein